MSPPRKANWKAMAGFAAVVMHPGMTAETAWRFDSGRLVCSASCDLAHPALVGPAGGERLVLEASPGALDVIDGRTGRVLRTMAGQGPLEISGDGSRIGGRNAAGTPMVWALATGKVIHSYDLAPSPIAAPRGLKVSEPAARPVLAAALPDGHRVLVFWRRFDSRWDTTVGPGDVLADKIAYEETLTINEIPNRKMLRSATLGSVVQQEGARDRLTVSACADGRRLLVQPPGHPFLLWDLASGAAPRPLTSAGKLDNARLLPDGKSVLGWNDSSLLLVDADSMKVLWSVEVGVRISALALRADGGRVAVGTTDGAVSVVDTGSGKSGPIYSLSATGDFAAAVSFSNNGRALVFATNRGALMKIVTKDPF